MARALASKLPFLALTFIVLPAFAYAAPGVPEQFYGAVKYDSGSPPEGLAIQAFVNGNAVASTTTESGNIYGQSPNLLLLPDADGSNAGMTVSFTVNGAAASETATYANATLTNLNLTVPGVAPGTSTAGSNSGGGGSSSGGGGGGSTSSGSSGSGGGQTHVPIGIPPVTGQVLGALTHNFLVDLKIGSIGAEVDELQKTLIAGGYLSISGPTGYFGPITKSAVTKYQSAHGILSTGYVGPLTRQALNGSTVTTSSLAPQDLATQIAQLMLQIKALQAQLAAQQGATT